MNNNNTTIELLISSSFKNGGPILSLANIDMTLQIDEPLRPIDESVTIEKKKYAKWEISNKLWYYCYEKDYC